MSRRKIEYRHIIGILLIISTLMLSVFVYQKSFYRLIQSIYDFGLSLAFYFCELFDIGHNIKPFTSNIFTGKLGSSASALPGTTTEVGSVFKMFFSLLFSGTNYNAYNVYLSSKLSIYLKLLVLILPLGIMAYRKMFSFVTVDYIVDFINRVNDAVWKIDFENLPEQKKHNIISSIILNDSQYITDEVLRLWRYGNEDNCDKIYRLIMQNKFLKESKKAKYKDTKK